MNKVILVIGLASGGHEHPDFPAKEEGLHGPMLARRQYRKLMHNIKGAEYDICFKRSDGEEWIESVRQLFPQKRTNPSSIVSVLHPCPKDR